MPEWDDSDFDDDDWPDDDDGESAVVNCPNCGEEVYDDAERCPACGDYIVHDSNAWSDKPLWWVLLGLAGIVAVIVLLTAVA